MKAIKKQILLANVIAKCVQILNILGSLINEGETCHTRKLNLKNMVLNGNHSKNFELPWLLPWTKIKIPNGRSKNRQTDAYISRIGDFVSPYKALYKLK